MKKIKYQVLCYAQITGENGETEMVETLAGVITDYSEEALDLAKQTAYNGEYTIVNEEESV